MSKPDQPFDPCEHVSIDDQKKYMRQWSNTEARRGRGLIERRAWIERHPVLFVLCGIATVSMIIGVPLLFYIFGGN